MKATTDGVVREPSARESRRRLAEQATARLVEATDAVLGDRLVLEPGTKPNYFDDGVSVDAFSITERCPRRLARPAEDYVDSVATARRRIGLLAMRRLTTDVDPARSDGPLRLDTRSRSSLESPARSVAVAVDEVMSSPDGWPNKLREWIEGLDRAGQAAVAAAVTTWCDGALRLVGRHAGVVWADPTRTPSWNLPGRIVQLRGSVDATIGGVVSGEKLLLLGDAMPGPADRLRAGFAALLRAVGTRHAPVRVTLGSAATGTMQQFAVGPDLLDLASDRVAEIVGHRADPDAAPPMPSRGCSHCHLLDLCDEGLDHLTSTSRPRPQ